MATTTDKILMRLDVAMDSSESPPTVSVNGSVMRFESKSDAEFVFDLLNSIRDAAVLRSECSYAISVTLRGLRAHTNLALGIEEGS